MVTEFLDQRFGVNAVEKGFITRDQLFEALKTQITEEIEKKEHRLLRSKLLLTSRMVLQIFPWAELVKLVPHQTQEATQEMTREGDRKKR